MSTDISDSSPSEESIVESEHEATAVEHGTETGHDEHVQHGWPDRKYIQLAVILALITALEVWASYADWLGVFFIPALMIMMAVKFLAVALFFMHLRFDSPIFSWMFYTGLIPAILIFGAMLMTFQFFAP
jgi:cytochrome c oxidase subunit 4